MNGFLFFALGACFGAMVGVVLMAVVAVAKDADEWGAELRAWDGGSSLYDWADEDYPGYRIGRTR